MGVQNHSEFLLYWESMKKSALFIAAFLAFSIGIPASAAEIYVGEQVNVSQDGVISENVYAAGGQTTVSSAVNGDAIVAGGRVVVSGNVSGDVAAAGGSVDIFESVNGDVRALGGQVTIGESVAGDVVVLGGSVSILSDVVVGGDLIVLGGAVFLDGAVNGDARLMAGELFFTGSVAGNVDARVETVSFEDTASIGGNFMYRANKEADIPESVTIGGEVAFTEYERTPQEVAAAPLAGLAVGFIVFQLVIFVVATIVMVLVFPKLSREVGVATTTRKAWRYAGIGFVTLVMLPVAASILFISILGAFLGGMVLIGYILLIAVAKAMTGITVGAYISRWTKKKAIVSWKWALLGVLVVELLALVPFFGWLILFVFFIITLGAITLGVYSRIRAEHTKA